MTASNPARIAFYFDPSCPWAYVTSRWAADVARQRGFEVEWRFFSLRAKNAPADMADEERRAFVAKAMGHRCLRVAAAVRDAAGNEAVARLYDSMGRRRHASGLAEKPDIGTPEELRTLLAGCGLDEGLAYAADEERWDAAIDADMAEAVVSAGDDVGVPIIVLDDGDGPAWFGPVVSRAPEGEEALRLWDAFEALARVPYLFEIKRGRSERPQLASLP